MKKRIGSYPHVRVEGGGRGAVSQAGSVLLVETIRRTGLDQAISAALAPWRKQRAVRDPGKVLLDVALAVALGGDCLADVGMLRAEPASAWEAAGMWGAARGLTCASDQDRAALGPVAVTVVLRFPRDAE